MDQINDNQQLTEKEKKAQKKEKRRLKKQNRSFASKVAIKLFKVVIVIFLICTILLSGALIAGKVTYDKFGINKKLDLKFGEALSLLMSLNKSKEGSYNNSYTDSDGEELLRKIENGLYLENDSLEYNSLTRVMVNMISKRDGASSEAALNDLFNQVKFNFNDLNSNKSIFTIEDKELASFLQTIVMELERQNFQPIVDLKQKIGINDELKNYFTIKQAKFINVGAEPAIELTLEAKVSNIVDKTLSSLQLPSVVGKSINNILNKVAFATLRIFPKNASILPEIALNGTYGNKKQQERLNKLLDGIPKIVGGNKDGVEPESFRKSIGDVVNGAISQLNKNNIFLELSKGSDDKPILEFKVFKTLLGLLGHKNIDDSQVNVLKEKFHNTILSLRQKNELTTNNEFSTADLNNLINGTFEGKLGIKPQYIKASEISELPNKLKDIDKNIDIVKFIQGNPNLNPIEILDKEFGSLLKEFMNQKMAENQILKDLNLSIAQLDAIKNGDEEKLVIYSSSFSIVNAIKGKIGGSKDSVQSKIIEKLLNSIVTENSMIKIEITLRDSSDDYCIKKSDGTYVNSTVIYYNKDSVNFKTKIKEIVNNCNELLGDSHHIDANSLNIDSLIETMDNQVKNTFDELLKVFGDGEKIHVASNKVLLPSFYKAIAKGLNITDATLVNAMPTTFNKIYIQGSKPYTDPNLNNLKNELMRNHITTIINEENIFGSLCSLKDNYKTQIDYVGLVSDTNIIKDIELVGDDLRLLIAKEVNKNMPPDLKFKDIKIHTFKATGTNKIKISFSSTGIEGVNVDLKALVPTLLNGEMELDMQDFDKSTLVMDELTGVQNQLLEKIISNLTNNSTFNLKNVVKQIAANLRASMNDLLVSDAKIKMTIQTDSVTITNIYDIMLNILYEDKPRDVTTNEFKSILNNINSTVGIDSVYKTNYSNVVVASSTTIYDKETGKMVVDSLSTSGTKLHNSHLDILHFLAKEPGSEVTKKNEIYSSLEAKYSCDISLLNGYKTKDVMLAKFNLQISDLVLPGGIPSGLFPDVLDITCLSNLRDSNEMSVFVNGMSLDESTKLFNLINTLASIDIIKEAKNTMQKAYKEDSINIAFTSGSYTYNIKSSLEKLIQAKAFDLLESICIEVTCNDPSGMVVWDTIKVKPLTVAPLSFTGSNEIGTIGKGEININI